MMNFKYEKLVALIASAVGMVDIVLNIFEFFMERTLTFLPGVINLLFSAHIPLQYIKYNGILIFSFVFTLLIQFMMVIVYYMSYKRLAYENYKKVATYLIITGIFDLALTTSAAGPIAIASGSMILYNVYKTENKN